MNSAAARALREMAAVEWRIAESYAETNPPTALRAMRKALALTLGARALEMAVDDRLSVAE